MSDFRRRSSLAVGASVIQQASTIFIQIVSVPLLLSHWGVAVYGVWLILSAVPTYLSLTDLGFGTAASNKMAMQFARGDLVGAGVSFTALMSITGISALLCGAVVIGMVAFIPVFWVPTNTVLSLADCRLIVLALSFAILLGMIRNSLYSVLYADGRNYIGILLLTIGRVLEFISLAAAIILGHSPKLASIYICAGALISTVVYATFVFSSTLWIRQPFTRASSREIKSLVAPSFSFLLFPLSNALNLQGVLLVVGAASTPEAVVLFSTLRTLSRLAVMPIRSAMDALRAEMSRSYGLNELPKLRRMLEALTWVCGALTVVIALVLSAFAPWIIKHWTTGHISIDWALYAFLLSAAAVQAIAYPSYMLLYASNLHSRIGFFQLVTNVVGILLCILLPFKYTWEYAAVLLCVEIAVMVNEMHRVGSAVGMRPNTILRSAFYPSTEVLKLIKPLIRSIGPFSRRRL